MEVKRLSACKINLVLGAALRLIVLNINSRDALFGVFSISNDIALNNLQNVCIGYILLGFGVIICDIRSFALSGSSGRTINAEAVDSNVIALAMVYRRCGAIVHSSSRCAHGSVHIVLIHCRSCGDFDLIGSQTILSQDCCNLVIHCSIVRIIGIIRGCSCNRLRRSRIGCIQT